ncbi:FAD-dependent oxidoreductase [Rheinheimera sp. MM224]|uniref:FAD-dependent oxidoreductase n=1 Tax=Rheinheimera sp. MM224 TaxID=3019969 RepID=UPI0021F8EF8C|nr:FAD-dependent oxidoreductase [Rheinheimera sp. MM224]CAI3805835.1 Nitrite reductase [NAD(P)H] [Rheinheimera sp. MM224]
MLTTEEAYQAANIQYRLNCWVEQINREQQLVVTSQGGQFYYDELVLATGSYAFVPPIPGNDQSHCLVYRTLQDLDAIAQSAAVSKIGGG